MLTDKELAQRDTKLDLGSKLLESVRAMKADKATRKTDVEPTLASQARAKIGISQTEFAEVLANTPNLGEDTDFERIRS